MNYIYVKMNIVSTIATTKKITQILEKKKGSRELK